MTLKYSVLFGNPLVAITAAMIIADGVYRDFGHNLTITSVNDSTHKEGSLHYKDLAFDCRTRDLKTGDAAKVFQLLKLRLTKDFDVVLESDHIHVEYDKK